MITSRRLRGFVTKTWTQMKMHILERRDAILADLVVALVEQKAHPQILRRLLARPRRYGRQYPAKTCTKTRAIKERRIASQRDLKVRKAIIALAEQASEAWRTSL